MSQAVQTSSIETYHQLEDSGTAGRIRDRVFRFIREHKYCTRRQVAHSLELETSCVAGRVNELITAGLVAETEQHVRCPITKRMVNGLREAPPQRRLFE